MKQILTLAAGAALAGLLAVAPASAGDLKSKCIAVNKADADPAIAAQADSGCTCFAEGVAAGKGDPTVASQALDHAAAADRVAVVNTDPELKALVESCWQL